MTNPDATARGEFLPRLLTQPVGPPPPVLWSAHTPHEQNLMLEELDGWVAWLTDRYRLDHRTVPGCWPQHAELIEELSALNLAWQAAYATLAPADGPMAWHEHFALARTRLTDWVARTGCRPGAHRAEQHAWGAAKADQRSDCT